MQKNRILLGIETSCDETSAAIIKVGPRVGEGEVGPRVLSNVIFSQISLHRKTGGVVPEVAAREHTMKIVPVISEALKKADIKPSDLDAIAYTENPGLRVALVIGITAAKSLAAAWKKPLIPVNHIEGHLYSPFLDSRLPKFPILTLSVSGGHNELFLIRRHHDLKLLGETLDDAAGEAFDKVARLLGLAYPGGPSIEKAAKKGNPNAIDFPRSMMHSKSLDFSFSGLKTAVLYYVKKHRPKSRQDIANIAASFQETVCDSLITKVLFALKRFPEIQEVHLTGGVSANLRLRKKLASLLPSKIVFHVPQKLSYCTDNAAMIACRGHFQKFLASRR